MKIGKTHLLLAGVFLLATVPAYGQRVMVGLDGGLTSDKFGGVPAVSGAVGGLEGEVTVLRGGGKQNWPSIVAGGEIRFPSNSNQHATEFAIHGGPIFRFGEHFSVGFHAQIRKVLVPPSTLNGITFNRLNLELLELPFVAEYKFSPVPKHAFLQAQVSPELTPHYKNSVSGQYPLPHPNFDHGYDIRGSVGYNFGKWYVKATYETRYFKFAPGLGNPNQIYDWKTNAVMGGVGLVF